MTNTNVVEKPAFVQDLEASHFQIAVSQAAAIMDKPEYNGKLQKAMDLVLSNRVTINPNGTATVKSGSHTYEIAPDCTCQDSQYNSMYCKHFLAVELLKRTRQRLIGTQPTTNGHQLTSQPEISQPASWQYAQAPSSCTLKWNVAGIELMLTLRDATDELLFARISKVLPKIEAKVEAQRQARQEQTPEQHKAEGYCAIHDVQMRQSKDGKGFYHKAGERSDGKAIWCRG